MEVYLQIVLTSSTNGKQLRSSCIGLSQAHLYNLQHCTTKHGMLAYIDDALSPEALETLKSRLKMKSSEKFSDLFISNVQISLIANI